MQYSKKIPIFMKWLGHEGLRFTLNDAEHECAEEVKDCLKYLVKTYVAAQ